MPTPKYSIFRNGVHLGGVHLGPRGAGRTLPMDTHPLPHSARRALENEIESGTIQGSGEYIVAIVFGDQSASTSSRSPSILRSCRPGSWWSCDPSTPRYLHPKDPRLTKGPTMKISRKKLIKIAFKAIAQNDAEKQYSPPAREDRNHLLYAACTMPQVALGAWAINDQCGCLVGTMLLNEKAPLEGKYVLESDPLYMQVDDAMQPNHPLWDVGIAFDDLLRAYLADKYSADDPEELHQQPVDVVDA